MPHSSLRRFSRHSLAAVILLALVSVAPLYGQSALITQSIDNAARIRVAGSVHPLANAANDHGRVDGNLLMQRMVLVLKPSDAQQASLTTLLDRQHDPDSQSYRHWLSPEEFGGQFGPSSDDIARITAWLQQQGFRVESVAHGKQFIEFSGTARQAENAFQTEMHRYVVGGKEYTANSIETSIPQAMHPVVAGVLSLHNFPKTAMHRAPVQVHRDTRTGQLIPDFTSQSFAHYLAPGDFARIYNTIPLLAERVNGKGVSIAIVGRTDIQLADVQTFRSVFRLPAKDPIFIWNGMDPGFEPSGNNGDEIESDLDVEWSGAVAPEADVKLVISGSTYASDGVDLSIAYIVDKVVAPIMSISYGSCEAFLGPAGNAFIKNMYQQAAAEGITTLVASGDNGAAGCDSPEQFVPAQLGHNVSGLASTPYNLAVGGTQFAENGLDGDGNYWLANNRPDLSSAIGYIPEAVWNASCDPTVDPNFCGGTGYYFLWAGSGGRSNCVQSRIINNAVVCETGYPKPSWQAGKGMVDDGVRDLPDLALAASGGDGGYLLCVEGSCQATESDGQLILQTATVVGGTSAASPSMAGVLALLEQHTDPFQGLANYGFYKLQTAENLASCNSTKLTDPSQANRCVFQDITVGDNSVPGQSGYSAKTGYDLATGLGSVNAENLVAKWSQAKKLSSMTELSTGVSSVQHGQPIPIDVTVEPRSGLGTPSGDFALETNGFGSVFGGTLTNGRYSGNVANLPGGKYSLTARYGGNAMFAASSSASLPVEITPESSSLTVTGWALSLVGTPIPLRNPVLFGEPVALQINVRGKSGVGNATGSVTILDGMSRLGSFPIGQNGNVFIQVDNLRAGGFAVGKHVLSVNYSGDLSFLPSHSSTVTVAVVKKQPVTHIRPSATIVTRGDPVELMAGIDPGGYAFFPPDGVHPTGNVQFMDGNTPISGKLPIVYNGPIGAGAAQVVFTTSLLAAGTHFLTANYDGDANYEPVTGPPAGVAQSITVNAANGVVPLLKVEQSPSVVKLGESINYVITVRPPNNGPTPSGTVSLSTDAVVAGPVPLRSGNATLMLTAPVGGKFVLSAQYSGDKTYSMNTSAPITTLVKPGTPIVTVSAAARSPTDNSHADLTVSVFGSSNPNLPSVMGDNSVRCTVQIFDSVDGGPLRALSAPQPLTQAANGTAIYTSRVVLPSGNNRITARYSGYSNWAATTSNAVILTVK